MSYMERLRVVNLDEIAHRWQIPVERVKYFITDLDMNPVAPEKWAVAHWEVFMQEKKEAFEDLLFPRPLRPEPTEATA